MHRLRIGHVSSEELRWLATTLVRCGDPLGTSIAIEGERLFLKW
jgi:hypothetical protein